MSVVHGSSQRRPGWLYVLLALAGFGLLAAWVWRAPTPHQVAAPAADQEPTGPLSAVAFEQRLEAQLPLELSFRDEAGRAVRLADFFGRGPVILSLNYFECPNLCPIQLQALARMLRALPFVVGRELTVLTVSIDPGGTPDLARRKKDELLALYRRPEAEQGWHLLTGDEDSIRRLTEAVGFRYRYDPTIDQFAHATGIVILTPQGRVSRYFYGLDYAPRDVRLALVEASAGKIGSPVDRLLLYCYRYNPLTGRYNLVRVLAPGRADDGGRPGDRSAAPQAEG